MKITSRQRHITIFLLILLAGLWMALGLNSVVEGIIAYLLILTGLSNAVRLIVTKPTIGLRHW